MMKKYKWILSGMATLALIIYACESELKDERIIASVDKIPNDMSFGWEAEEHSIDGYDNTFTFVSDANWCVISGDKIKVEANNANQSREASIHVNWKNETMKTIRIRQSETGHLNGLPETLSFGNQNTVKIVELTSNTSWTVSSNQEWCSVTPTYGSGNASVRVSVTDNTTSSIRTAHITFKYGDQVKVITVTQEYRNFLFVTPTSINAEATAGSYSLDITSNTFWFVHSSHSWCSVTPEFDGYNSSISVNVSANTSTSPRTATITISPIGLLEETVSVTQAGMASAVPSNDQCSEAILLSCDANLDGTTVGATPKTIPYNDVSKYGVWYTFVGDGREIYIAVNSTTRYYFKMILFSGSCSNLTYIDSKSSGTSQPIYIGHKFITTYNTKYYVYIAHLSSNGSSTQTGTFSISCANVLSVPRNVRATKANPYHILVSWDSVPEATNYEVFFSTRSDGPFDISLGTTTSTSMIDYNPNGLGPNYFKVVAKNSNPLSTSDYSNTAYYYWK